MGCVPSVGNHVISLGKLSSIQAMVCLLPLEEVLPSSWNAPINIIYCDGAI